MTGKRSTAMRTRNQSKRTLDNLSDVSKDAVGRLIKRVKSHSVSDNQKTDETYLLKSDSLGIQENGLEMKNECSPWSTLTTNDKYSTGYEVKSIPADTDQSFELDESEWEDGSIRTLNSLKRDEHEINGITVEFDISPDSGKRKTIRRATAEEKERAELVHKVNLLCLLGRGRLVDQACNDPLIQACICSLLPPHLLKIAEVPILTAKSLTPLVNWFHHRFHVTNTSDKRTPSLALAHALEAQEGTAEEVAALSVALFRALNFTTRFVAVLDVASLKPEVDKPEASIFGKSKRGSGIFNSSTLMVTRSSPSLSPSVSQSADMEGLGQTSVSCEKNVNSRKSLKAVFENNKISQPSTSESCGASKSKGKGDLEPCGASKLKGKGDLEPFDAYKSKGKGELKLCGASKLKGKGDLEPCGASKSKGKGDIEFELQLDMALAATSIENSRNNTSSSSCLYADDSKVVRREESSVSVVSDVSTAIGSRKVGQPLYWAEVYCNGENLTGKWVHVDTVNAIIDGEQRVEVAAAACKKTLKYVVAFAGLGAKDVTRRYCMQWCKVASQRVNTIWWDVVLSRLKEMESQATDKSIHLQPETLITDKSSNTASSSLLEDMELETRSLTEPLPTNQQAYRNHQLYAIERWLGKYQVLHPKGPVLGFCSGHPVYPRTCVQTLYTRRKWLREGCQVKADELPVKVLKRSSKHSKAEAVEDDDPVEGDEVALFGKWQTEPLCLPHAVDGIVPKNERGQVEVWSEKCVPPGTIHLRLPRVGPIAKRLEIDYAPAMVGFEYRNGRSVPVFEGIVVCREFEDAILEAYNEEESRREVEERKRNEAQALSRWYQLLSSIVTRQRLKNCYGDGALMDSAPHEGGGGDGDGDGGGGGGGGGGGDDKKSSECKKDTYKLLPTKEEGHQHVFIVDDETFEDEISVRTKRCLCGFSIEYEQL